MGFYALKELLMQKKSVKLFLRLAISLSFLSAVADHFGMWEEEVSVWGNWQSFVDYTAVINPWMPTSVIPTLAAIATVAEIVFGVFLLIGYKTELFAKLSGILLLIFALCMTFSIGIKSGFDYSVFTASAAAFGLGLIKEKYLEVDSLRPRKRLLE